MGKDKGLAKLAGKPLVMHVCDILLEAVDEIVVAVAPGAAKRYSEVLGGRARILEDPKPGLGPLQGMVTAMSGATGDSVLFVPCDTPFIRPAVCTLIIASARSGDGAVPRVGPYYEPLHGCFKMGSAGKFRETLASGSRKPQDAFRKLKVVPVPEARMRELDPDLLSFWSINSKKDLAEAEEMIVEGLTSRASCAGHMPQL